MYFVFIFCRLRPFFATNCKDSASREENKINVFIFSPEAPPILFKDSASRLLFAAYLIQR